MQNLPENLYCVDSIVQLEQSVIQQYAVDGIDQPAYQLMTQAGEAVFEVIKSRYSDSNKILVLCGAGNNAGDGYVVARLASKNGYDVHVVSLIDPLTLSTEALIAYKDWSESGSVIQADNLSTKEILEKIKLESSDIIIDALLGTGLKRPLSEQWCGWIKTINSLSNSVLSVDIPSGLYADTGYVAEEAIQADITACFVGLKQGMFTSQAKDFCGEIVYSDLAIPQHFFSQVKLDACLINKIEYSLLAKRKASSHKGKFGHVLIVGGGSGMPGAVILAARAALRTGAGLVTIITIKEHFEAICNAVPEAMIKTCTEKLVYEDKGETGVTNEKESAPFIGELFKQSFINEITHVAVGMGLGQDDWSISILEHCLQLQKPVLIDADGLNLLAAYPHLLPSITSDSLTLTPHPGEAARLLSVSQSGADSDRHKAISSNEVQSDRFSAIKKISELYGKDRKCVVILKGSGTLIYDGELIKICRRGSAAMAAPGMGDVLSGITIALQAQGLEVREAAEQAVCLHACAAESVTGDKTRGLLASDIIDALKNILQ